MLSVKLDVVLAPSLLSEKEHKKNLCAVIDVLRATTSIITALANGARKVIPFMNAGEARAYATKLAEGAYLLGGEEGGLRIPDFHLGNSPYEYLPQEIVASKTILFATTNGTPMMRLAHARSELPVLIAALSNISAVSERAIREIEQGTSAKVALICAGRHGWPGAEDIFCGGLIAEEISKRLDKKRINVELTDSALIAATFARENKKHPLKVLTESNHGRQLTGIGFAKDMEFAAEIDRFDIVPIFNGEDIALRP